MTEGQTSFEDAYREWRKLHLLLEGRMRFFVVGCAKSGTTWLMNLLGGHPEVVVRGEGGFAWRLVPMLMKALAAFNEHQRTYKMDPITRLRDIDGMFMARAVIDGQFVRYLTETPCDLARIRAVGDKTPQHVSSLPALHALFPAAKFVHIVRDPRDVATSAWFHLGRTDPRYSFESYVRTMIVQSWGLQVAAARKAGAALAGRYLELRYEDLLSEEVSLVRRMLRFLEVDDSDAVVRVCMEAGSFKKRSGGRDRGQTDEKSFYRSGVAGDWRNHIPAALAAEACAPVAGLMAECGYDP